MSYVCKFGNRARHSTGLTRSYKREACCWHRHLAAGPSADPSRGAIATLGTAALAPPFYALPKTGRSSACACHLATLAAARTHARAHLPSAARANPSTIFANVAVDEDKFLAFHALASQRKIRQSLKLH